MSREVRSAPARENRLVTKPLVILGAPRSGTTILFRVLALHRELWHLPSEAHAILEGPLKPETSEYESNRVETGRFSEPLLEELRTEFYEGAINLRAILNDPTAFFYGRTLARRAANRLGQLVLGGMSKMRKPHIIRLVEKTPRNTLRVPFLEDLFPEPLYIRLVRDPVDNIRSLVNGWLDEEYIGPFKRRRFSRAGYRIACELSLRDYAGAWWKFALVPGWETLHGRSVAEVAAYQYYQCNKVMLSDLRQIPNERIFSVRHEEFHANRESKVQDLLDWAGLASDDCVNGFVDNLPRVNVTTRTNRNESAAIEWAIANTEGLPELVREMGYAGARW